MTDSDHDGDETIEAERTVIVDRAHALREQMAVNCNEIQATDNEIQETYHTARATACERYLSQLESNGLDEAEVRQAVDDYDEKINAHDEGETPEYAKYIAEHDTAIQVVREYFGGFDSDPVSIGRVRSTSVLKDETVQFEGTEGVVRFQLETREDAMAVADTTLAFTDLSTEQMAEERFQASL